MKITLVKKVLSNGSPCRKCADVLSKLEHANYMQRIDKIIDADEADPTSAGMLLAKEYGVDRAPFFIVEYEDGHVDVYTVYLKFVMEVLEA
ncbi:hypothetical protein QWI17_07510 [Gilvimarinus sp. SDUM040013]|uniref:Uncharacterized protein n=1 Tax=Gilvimarinus gilvus TaxID=3058038 RepID=A0ABU4RXC3_9GAMM|nr:hypothetical protein [Gilvimarinus sp. SDUM040013]MDO3385681.1 hypothetical protein [Gilvimarinus sp. SDUM040013]MDX6849319.1 hypothetical protein [Gilvimarinus sp. SDUM040013]